VNCKSIDQLEKAGHNHAMLIIQKDAQCLAHKPSKCRVNLQKQEMKNLQTSSIISCIHLDCEMVDVKANKTQDNVSFRRTPQCQHIKITILLVLYNIFRFFCVTKIAFWL